MLNAPCKNCPKRTETCHDTCEEYLAYKRNLQAIKTALKQENELLIPRDALLKREKRKKRNLTR